MQQDLICLRSDVMLKISEPKFTILLLSLILISFGVGYIGGCDSPSTVDDDTSVDDVNDDTIVFMDTLPMETSYTIEFFVYNLTGVITNWSNGSIYMFQTCECGVVGSAFYEQVILQPMTRFGHSGYGGEASVRITLEQYNTTYVKINGFSPPDSSLRAYHVWLYSILFYQSSVEDAWYQTWILNYFTGLTLRIIIRE